MGNLQVQPAVNSWERVGIFSAASAGAEIGLGSTLHTLHIPFSGHVMANTQGLILAAFLNRQKENRKYVFFVSSISAALKSFSPSGKRFRPMLAISVQGLLYHLSVNILGVGAAGITAGQALIGAWCSFQTFAFQYLFFGSEIVKSYEKIFEILGKLMPGVQVSPLQALAFWIALHSILSAVIGLAGYYGFLRFSVKKIQMGGLTLRVAPQLPSWKDSAREAAKELKRPYFLWPLLFVAAMGWLGRRDLESLAFVLSRAVLAAFLCILAVKRLDFPAIARWLDKKGHAGPAKALNTAIEELSGTRNA